MRAPSAQDVCGYCRSVHQDPVRCPSCGAPRVGELQAPPRSIEDQARVDIRFYGDLIVKHPTASIMWRNIQ